MYPFQAQEPERLSFKANSTLHLQRHNYASGLERVYEVDLTLSGPCAKGTIVRVDLKGLRLTAPCVEDTIVRVDLKGIKGIN